MRFIEGGKMRLIERGRMRLIEGGRMPGCGSLREGGHRLSTEELVGRKEEQ